MHFTSFFLQASQIEFSSKIRKIILKIKRIQKKKFLRKRFAKLNFCSNLFTSLIGKHTRIDIVFFVHYSLRYFQILQIEVMLCINEAPNIRNSWKPHYLICLKKIYSRWIVFDLVITAKNVFSSIPMIFQLPSIHFKTFK